MNEGNHSKSEVSSQSSNSSNSDDHSDPSELGDKVGDNSSDDLDSRFSEYAKLNYDYEVNSDDTVDAIAVINYAHPKYLGDANDMDKLKRKKQIINQYIFASQLELEFKKINVQMEVQTNKATKFINSLNTDVIQEVILG